MGRNLFIRVSASTYDEDRVAKDWPDLFELAWPSIKVADRAREKIAESFSPKGRGVLDLASRMVDSIAYGELSEAQRARMAPLGKDLQARLTGLENALGNRDVASADKLTNAIEDSLDAMEDALRGK